MCVPVPHDCPRPRPPATPATPAVICAPRAAGAAFKSSFSSVRFSSVIWLAATAAGNMRQEDRGYYSPPHTHTHAHLSFMPPPVPRLPRAQLESSLYPGHVCALTLWLHLAGPHKKRAECQRPRWGAAASKSCEPSTGSSSALSCGC